jgi:hypothetical protein
MTNPQKINHWIAEQVHGEEIMVRQGLCFFKRGRDGFDPYHNDTQAREALEAFLRDNPAYDAEIYIYDKECEVSIISEEDAGCGCCQETVACSVATNKSLSAAISEAIAMATGYKEED